MKITTFNRQLWNLTTFERVGYDKCNHVFSIYLFNGNQIEFFDVSETVVFQFVISKDKESFLRNILFPSYPYIEHHKRVSKLS